jgi:hypothetical protein
MATGGSGKKRVGHYLGKTTRTGPNLCPSCGKLVDAATGVSNQRRPTPGSIIICISCGHLAAYDDQLKIRPLTDEEVIGVAGDERIITLQKARGLAIKYGIKL